MIVRALSCESYHKLPDLGFTGSPNVTKVTRGARVAGQRWRAERPEVARGASSASAPGLAPLATAVLAARWSVSAARTRADPPAAAGLARRPRSHHRSLGIDISSSRSSAATVITASVSSGVFAMDSQTTTPENSVAHRYMISTLERWE